MNIMITGASSGIGKALAEFYSKSGNTVFISARREERLEEISAELTKSGFKCYYKMCDVTDKKDVEVMVNGAYSKMGSIDLAILNAGVGITSKFAELDTEIYRKAFDVNFFGVLNAMEVIIPIMKKQGFGKIAAVSSLADARGIPFSASYSTSKAALTKVLEAARIELKPYNIEVVTIRPGFVVSEMTDQNNYKMPLIMPVERAVKIITHRLAKKKAYIDFPYRTYLVSTIVGLIPNRWYEWIMSRVREN